MTIKFSYFTLNLTSKLHNLNDSLLKKCHETATGNRIQLHVVELKRQVAGKHYYRRMSCHAKNFKWRSWTEWEKIKCWKTTWHEMFKHCCAFKNDDGEKLSLAWKVSSSKCFCGEIVNFMMWNSNLSCFSWTFPLDRTQHESIFCATKWETKM